MNKNFINNQIVSMRGKVKKVKCQVINNVVRNIRKLKEKKGSEVQKTKNLAKADRLAAEIQIIKKLLPDEVSKYSLLSQVDSKSYKPEFSDAKIKALNRLMQHKTIVTAIEDFKEKNIEQINRIPHLFNLWELQQRQKKKKSKPSKGDVSSKNLNSQKNEISDEIESKKTDDEIESKKTDDEIKSKKTDNKISVQKSPSISRNVVEETQNNSDDASDLRLKVDSSDSSDSYSELVVNESDSSENSSDQESVAEESDCSRNDSGSNDLESDSSDVSELEINHDISQTNNAIENHNSENKEMVIKQLDLSQISDDEIEVLKTKPHEIEAKNSFEKRKNIDKSKKSSFFIKSDEEDEESSEGETEKDVKFTGNRKQRRQKAFGRTGILPQNLKRNRGKFEKKNDKNDGAFKRREKPFVKEFKSQNSFRKQSRKYDDNNANLVQPDNTKSFKKFSEKSSPSLLKPNAVEDIHPSWLAKRKQKEMLSKLPQNQGKKIKFN